MRLFGTILWYSERDGNGIIKDDKGVEFYFDKSVFKGSSMPEKRLNVTFVLNEAIKDCRCAKDVNIIGELS